LYLMNWEKKDEKDRIENQFIIVMSRPSRTRRCGLPELHGGRTFRRRQKLRNIIRSTSTTVVGVSIVLQAKRELLNTSLNQVTVRDWE
jgi:hypothetical protein